MAVERDIERLEFETITRRLVRRAATGRGRVAAVGLEDSEDVVQSAWEKVVRQDAPLPRGGELEAHVHEALVDVSVDHRRAQRRRRVVPSEQQVRLEAVPEEALGVVHPRDDSHAALAVRELLGIVLDIVGEGGAAYAILDALGLSEKEIAVELEITETEAGALRKRVARARPAIAAAINQHVPQPREDR